MYNRLGFSQRSALKQHVLYEVRHPMIPIGVLGCPCVYDVAGVGYSARLGIVGDTESRGELIHSIEIGFDEGL